MRTKNGKWIGSVPITLVAALALAAFISAGLWLVPNNGAQAQESRIPLEDVTLDVGETGSISNAVVAAAFSLMPETGVSVVYILDSDQDDPDTAEGQPNNVTGDDDENGEIDAQIITIVETTGAINISAPSLDMAGQGNNSAEITVTAFVDLSGDRMRDSNEAIQQDIFVLTVIHNPIEDRGTEFTSALDDGNNLVPYSCTLMTTGDDEEPKVYKVPTSATGEPVPVASPQPGVITSGERLIEGGACTISQDSLDVSFVNTGVNVDDINHLVYVTGGSAFQSVNSLSTMFKTSGLNEEILTLPKQTIAGVGKDPITVDRSMANSDGFVYLIVYLDEPDANNRIDATGKVFKGHADLVIKVQFLGQPALGKDGPEDENKKVDEDEARSRLEASTDIHDFESFPATGLTQVFDGTEAALLLTGATGPAATSASIRATVQDENEEPLKDVEVTFAATSEPADVESTIRVEDTNADGIALRTISGLPTNKGYRVTVTVTAGSLNLGKIIIARAGDLVDGEITDDKRGGFTATTCVDDPENDNKNDGCGSGSKPKAAFGVDAAPFQIGATVRDALGNDLAVTSNTTIPVRITAEESIDGISVGNFNNGVANVTIVESEVEGGSYVIDLTATQGTGDDQKTATTKVTFAISGELDHYAIVGDDRLEPREIKTFMVEAQDVRNNPAEFDDDQLTAGTDDNDATVQKHEVSIFVDGDTDMVFNSRPG